MAVEKGLHDTYRPIFYHGEWWVDIGDRPRAFPTAESARRFIKHAAEMKDRCLYHQCLRQGKPMPGMGVGFRFCERHARNAKKILDKTNRGTAIFRGASFENI